MARNPLRIVSAVAVTALVGVAIAADANFPRDWFFPHDAEQWKAHSDMVGKPAPKLELSGWVNGEVKPEDMKGKIIVLDFWATWCGPCIRSIPHNNDMAAKYKDKGVLVIGICGSENGQEKMELVAKDKGIQYPTAKDATLQSAPAWKVMWWPTYCVIDRKGNVRGVGLTPDGVEKAVKKVLEEQPAEKAA